jgi:hypothetical protein
MKTTLTILLAAAAATTLSAALAKKSELPKPNIILMVADDLGFGDLGCYGATKVKTPNIDRLAAQGVRLTDAHAPAAVCQPTRYGILTGRYHWRAKRTGNGYYFQDNEILLPEVLRQSGYATAAFGKWHLGWGLDQQWPADLWTKPISHGPNQAGFDYSFMQASGHEWPPFVFVENGQVYKGDPKDPLTIVKETPANFIAAYAGGQGSSKGAKAAHEAYDVERLDLEIAERANDWIGQQKKPCADPALEGISRHEPGGNLRRLSPAIRPRGRNGSGFSRKKRSRGKHPRHPHQRQRRLPCAMLDRRWAP